MKNPYVNLSLVLDRRNENLKSLEESLTEVVAAIEAIEKERRVTFALNLEVQTR